VKSVDENHKSVSYSQKRVTPLTGGELNSHAQRLINSLTSPKNTYTTDELIANMKNRIEKSRIFEGSDPQDVVNLILARQDVQDAIQVATNQASATVVSSRKSKKTDRPLSFASQFTQGRKNIPNVFIRSQIVLDTTGNKSTPTHSTKESVIDESPNNHSSVTQKHTPPTTERPNMMDILGGASKTTLKHTSVKKNTTIGAPAGGLFEEMAKAKLKKVDTAQHQQPVKKEQSFAALLMSNHSKIKGTGSKDDRTISMRLQDKNKSSTDKKRGSANPFGVTLKKTGKKF